MKVWKYTFNNDGVKVEEREEANIFICALCGSLDHPQFDPDDQEFVYCMVHRDVEEARAAVVKEADKVISRLNVALDEIEDLKHAVMSQPFEDMDENWIEEMEEFVNKKGDE